MITNPHMVFRDENKSIIIFVSLMIVLLIIPHEHKKEPEVVNFRLEIEMISKVNPIV